MKQNLLILFRQQITKRGMTHKLQSKEKTLINWNIMFHKSFYKHEHKDKSLTAVNQKSGMALMISFRLS